MATGLMYVKSFEKNFYIDGICHLSSFFVFLGWEGRMVSKENNYLIFGEGESVSAFVQQVTRNGTQSAKNKSLLGPGN